MSKARTLNPFDMEARIHDLEANGGGGGGTTDAAKRSDIATEFSAETSYTAGNYVYYNGKLYIFNVDHAAGAWDATDVSVANVTDEVTSNKAAIDQLDDEVSEKVSTDEGTFEDSDSHTYTGVTVDMLSYDETNNQLLLKVDGADSVIPFSHGGSAAQVATGTFQSPNEQYGTVDINCGFEPDLILVTIPLNGWDTIAYWWREASWSATKALWCLYTAEASGHASDLDRQTGETGIQSIKSNGFSYIVNGANVRGVTCKYIAVKY